MVEHTLQFPQSIQDLVEVSHLQFVNFDRRVVSTRSMDAVVINDDHFGDEPDDYHYLMSSHYDGTICCFKIGGATKGTKLHSSFLFQFKTSEEEDVGVLYFDVDRSSGAVYSANTDGTVRVHYPFKSVQQLIKSNIVDCSDDIASNSGNNFLYDLKSREERAVYMDFLGSDQAEYWKLCDSNSLQQMDETDDSESVEKTSFKKFLASKKVLVDKSNLMHVNNRIIGRHNDAVNHVFYIEEIGCVASASWDGFLKYWDINDDSCQPLLQLDLKGTVHAMDVHFPLLIITTAPRNIILFDLTMPHIPVKIWKSNLKCETQKHCLKFFSDRFGFIISTIEGRAAIHHMDSKNVSSNFIFKCHRTANDVFAPNSIDFNPLHGTFSTTGADKKAYFWDKDSKQKIYTTPNTAREVGVGKFSQDGSLFAYVVQYDYSKGKYGLDSTSTAEKVAIHLHKMLPAEIENRGKFLTSF